MNSNTKPRKCYIGRNLALRSGFIEKEYYMKKNIKLRNTNSIPLYIITLIYQCSGMWPSLKTLYFINPS